MAGIVWEIYETRSDLVSISSFNAKRQSNTESLSLFPVPPLPAGSLCANVHVCQVNSAALPSFSLPHSSLPLFCLPPPEAHRRAAAAAATAALLSLPPSRLLNLPSFSPSLVLSSALAEAVCASVRCV